MEKLWSEAKEKLYESMGIEPTPVSVNPEEEDNSDIAMNLSQELDVDALNEDFTKFAGMDDILSRAEYDTFIKTRKIPQAISGVLWSLLDVDGSGEVSKAEFKSALVALQSSRSWSRYCPSCEYRNDCAICQECNSGCSRCSEVCFCASCWNDHPGRQQTLEEQDNLDREPHQFGTVEYMRETVLIRPLEWAYHSRALRGLPVQYKAGMRQMLADQKQKADAAAKEAAAATEIAD